MLSYFKSLFTLRVRKSGAAHNMATNDDDNRRLNLLPRLRVIASQPLRIASQTLPICRGGVRCTRGLGLTMNARGQNIGIGGDYRTKDIQVLHYGI